MISLICPLFVAFLIYLIGLSPNVGSDRQGISIVGVATNPLLSSNLVPGQNTITTAPINKYSGFFILAFCVLFFNTCCLAGLQGAHETRLRSVFGDPL